MDIKMKKNRHGLRPKLSRAEQKRLKNNLTKYIAKRKYTALDASMLGMFEDNVVLSRHNRNIKNVIKDLKNIKSDES
tara:strand:+ start:46 stop:276 length:231 start_codon:yes stop_codon:yes gene_type:complete